jgi:hypothetical protein
VCPELTQGREPEKGKAITVLLHLMLILHLLAASLPVHIPACPPPPVLFCPAL